MPDDDGTPEIPFTPVPSAHTRRDGWTEARQREFIAALARCGSVRAAARQVGMSARGAYRLRERAGAGSFAEAWEQAVIIGVDATRDCVIDRAMNGAWVPVVRRGRIVRVEYRYFDRLAMAVLAGGGRDIERDRAHRAGLSAWRKQLREEDARRAAAEAAGQQWLDEAIERNRAEEKAARVPRIRSL